MPYMAGVSGDIAVGDAFAAAAQAFDFTVHANSISLYGTNPFALIKA